MRSCVWITSSSPLLLVAAACSFNSAGLGITGSADETSTDATSSGPSATSTTTSSTAPMSTDSADASTTPVDPTTGTDTSGTSITSASASTSMDTTGAPSGLDDNGLVVRYYLDEADGGQGPKFAEDAAPAPLDLPLVYDENGMNPVYAGGLGQRGLSWPAAMLDGRATIPVLGTKVQSQLTGSPTATIEVVLDLNEVTMFGSRIVHIGGGSEPGWLTLRTDSPIKAQTYWQGDVLAGEWDLNWDLVGRVVVHLVYDTTEMDPVDRVRFYVNGVEFVDAAGDAVAPMQDQMIEIPGMNPMNEEVHFTLGNRGVAVQRSFAGALHYVALYDEALSSAQIDKNFLALIASDDAP